jgi:aspartyl-tRNA synthetase
VEPFGSLRTDGAGTLRSADLDRRVVLGGWVASSRDHGGVVFLDLRDRSGVVQVVAEAEGVRDAAGALRSEFVVRVEGTVRARPEGTVNPGLSTGEVEVEATAITVLSPSLTPPFPVADDIETDEALRLRHRYVDLRRPRMASAIILRARAVQVIRRVMEANGFLEIETPILTKSTPEGARDFLVPARLAPGRFYALPQSPQLFKQLLMVAGMERYYQIARSFRDEDQRSDRQLEFTQLDLEASFVVEADIHALLEEVFAALWSELLGVEISLPLPRLSFGEALRRFGSDKPDTRYGLELVELDKVVADTGFQVFAAALGAGGTVVGLRLPGGGDLSRREFDELVDFARGRGAKGLVWMVAEPGGELRSPVRKFLSDAEVAGLREALGAQDGDAVFLAADAQVRAAQELLGAVRVELARRRGLVPQPGTRPTRWDFLWVTAPPMFEWDAEGDRWDAAHHPFVQPSPEFRDTFDERPGEATATAFDLVLNGVELGTGSLRIHDPAMQQRVFALLGIAPEEAQERFSFLLRGLSYGAPPHGGMGLGLDRIVMLMAGRSSIRDVIPFPKLQSGGDPLTDAPSTVEPRQLTDLGIAVRPAKR